MSVFAALLALFMLLAVAVAVACKRCGLAFAALVGALICAGATRILTYTPSVPPGEEGAAEAGHDG